MKMLGVSWPTARQEGNVLCQAEEPLTVRLAPFLLISLLLTGCQVVYPTRNGYAAAAILTNSRRIEVSSTGAVIDHANVSNPVGTTLSGVGGVMMSAGTAGAL